MSHTDAVGVTHAAHINKACAQYGVPPALIQGMRDIDGVEFLTLPEACVTFAEEYAVARGTASAANENGALEPEAHFMSVAWFLNEVSEMKGSDWASVVAFYGDTPRARIVATKIAAGPYEVRRRAWR